MRLWRKAMIFQETDYVCPLCGLILYSLAEFHKHVKRDHGQ